MLKRPQCGGAVIQHADEKRLHDARVAEGATRYLRSKVLAGGNETEYQQLTT